MSYLRAIVLVCLIGFSTSYDQECVGKRNGSTFSDPEDCARYKSCTGGFVSVSVCENGLYWHNLRRKCLSDVPRGCKVVEQSTEPIMVLPIIPTTFAPGAEGSEDVLDYDCPTTGVSSIPDRNSCSKFILCFDGTAVQQSCAPGLHFNAAESQCTFREQASCNLQDHVCPDKNEPFKLVFVADRFDCSKYFYCYNGQLHPHSCASGLHWDPVNNWCTKISESRCENFTPYTEVSDPLIKPKTITCKDDLARWTNHPKSDKHYYLCYKGKAFLKRCDDGLVWDSKSNSCNFAH